MEELWKNWLENHQSSTRKSCKVGFRYEKDTEGEEKSRLSSFKALLQVWSSKACTKLAGEEAGDVPRDVTPRWVHIITPSAVFCKRGGDTQRLQTGAGLPRETDRENPPTSRPASQSTSTATHCVKCPPIHSVHFLFLFFGWVEGGTR